MHTTPHDRPRRRWSRLLLAAGMVAGTLAVAAAPAEARGAQRVSVSGVGIPEATPCDADAPLATTMTGDLEGCLSIFPGPGRCIESPNGIVPDRYIERGQERFEGTIMVDGEPKSGSFETKYIFKATFAPGSGCDFSQQLAGGCVHPIVPGSGTDGMAGLKSGLLTFTDRIESPPNWASDFPYTGFVVFRN